jgi:hypothetical protein
MQTSDTDGTDKYEYIRMKIKIHSSNTFENR